MMMGLKKTIQLLPLLLLTACWFTKVDVEVDPGGHKKATSISGVQLKDGKLIVRGSHMAYVRSGRLVSGPYDKHLEIISQDQNQVVFGSGPKGQGLGIVGSVLYSLILDTAYGQAFVPVVIETGSGPNDILQLNSYGNLPLTGQIELTRNESDVINYPGALVLKNTSPVQREFRLFNHNENFIIYDQTAGASRLEIDNLGNVTFGGVDVCMSDGTNCLGTGSVTSVGSGTGLLGGPITSSGTLSVDVGTGANQIVQLDASARLPSVDGSQLTKVGTSSQDGVVLNPDGGGNNGELRFIDNGGTNYVGLKAPATVPSSQIFVLPQTDGTPDQVLKTDGFGNLGWTSDGGGTVTSITAGTGLTGGTITTSGTIAVDVGTTAGKIVQVDGTNKLPAIDGSQLTNLNATQINAGVSNTEFGYLSNVTSDIQTQLNSKEGSLATGALTEYYRGDKNWATLNTDAVAEATNLYFTDGRAQTAVVSATISNGVTTKSPSEDAVFDALALKENSLPTGGLATHYLDGAKTWQTLDTDAVAEATNLYFTEARVLATPLTGYSVGTNTSLAATDSLLTALGKLEAQNGASGDFMADGSVAMTGSFDGGANAITNVSTVSATSDITTNAKLRMKDNDGVDNFVELRAPATLASTLTFTFPDSYGTNGQVLKSDGFGGLSWVTPSVGSVTSVTATLPLSSSGGSTPDISISQASSTTDGYLSATDWNTFASKEGALPSGGLATHYLDGNKTWQTLNTTAVAEGTNLYYTDARARAAVSATAPLSYNSSTGAMSVTGLSSLAGTDANKLMGVDAAGAAIEYKDILGTTNQISVTHGAGTVTLATPQSIHTAATPTFAGMSLTGALSMGTSAITGVADPTNAQDAATKSYVDTTVNGVSGTYVDTAGDTMTGTLNLPANGLAVGTNQLLVSGGNVGVGISPTEKLHVNGAIRANLGEGFKLYGDANYFGSNLDAIVFQQEDGNSTGGATDGGFVFQGYTPTDTTAKEWMVIKTPGNVGIGTSDPIAPLHSFGGTAMSAGYNRTAVLNANHPTLQFKGIGDSNHSGGIGYDAALATEAMRFWVGATTDDIHGSGVMAMSIRSTGNVGIGVSSPTEKLEVNGNVKATSFLYTSDRRLKTGIERLDDVLDKIDRLRGVRFNWKENGEEEIGFIAQEVEEVYPELVVTNPDTGLKSVKYGNVVAVLVEGMKQLREEKDKEIKELKREVASLKELVCLDHPNAEVCKK